MCAVVMVMRGDINNTEQTKSRHGAYDLDPPHQTVRHAHIYKCHHHASKSIHWLPVALHVVYDY